MKLPAPYGGQLSLPCHNCPLIDHILCHMNSILATISYIFNIRCQIFHLRHGGSSVSILSSSLTKTRPRLFSSHTCLLSRLFHVPWFYYPNIVRGWVKNLKLFNIQFYPVSCYLSHISLNIFLSTLFSVTHSLYSSLNKRETESYTHIKQQAIL